MTLDFHSLTDQTPFHKDMRSGVLPYYSLCRCSIECNPITLQDLVMRMVASHRNKANNPQETELSDCSY